MKNIHRLCRDTAETYGAPDDYVLGANIAGFTRVAAAMASLGVV
jgi:glutamate dehydrogenase (NADP+)